jgi:hypothetical protein
LTKNHLALLLSALVSIGILDGLVKVVLESKLHLSIRAVILLGELLHLCEVLLPVGVCTSERQSCLKLLVAVGTNDKSTPEERERASRSLSALARIHSLKKRPPKPYSLFLEQLMVFANYSGLRVIASKHLDGVVNMTMPSSRVSVVSPTAGGASQVREAKFPPPLLKKRSQQHRL